MTQIFLIRHGETVWNLETRIQGHLDSPLTETGLAQAEALASRFKSQRFSALYSSDIGRAYETARRISEKNGLSILTEPCLRERHFGVLQSELKKTLPTRFPEIFHYFKANDPDYIIPEGESLKQFSERCITCLEGLAKKHVGERILVVTHGGVLVSLFKHTLGIPLSAPRHFLSLNTSINVFSYQDKRWTLEVWGDLGHLHGVLAVDDSSV